MKLNIKKFNDLTNEELYRLLELRFNVFVYEHEYIYNEFDGQDRDAIHIFYKDDEAIVATIRVFKDSKDSAVMSRFIVKKDFRSKGLGKKIFEECLEYIKKNLSVSLLKLGAQEYYENFYGGFGFTKSSDVYMEGNSPHIRMRLKL
jgi:ElaA protein